MAPRSVSLQIEPQRLEAFCERLRRSAATPARAVAGIAALQTFLAETTEPGEKAGAAYEQVRQVLAAQLRNASEQVLADSAQSLAEAGRQRDAAAVAAIHRTVSRSGFREALERARHLAGDDGRDVRAWAAAWCRDAEQRAQAASGYPEAYDFRAAGIPVDQYAAMCDLRDY